MNEQEKLIEEQKKTLPPELVQAINAVQWKNAVQEISGANNLTPDQAASLEQETMLIIYAFEPPTNYISNLSRELGVSEEVASTIADQAAEKIFNPISEKVVVPQTSKVPEIAHNNLPMVESGEVAHDVPRESGIKNQESRIELAPQTAQLVVEPLKTPENKAQSEPVIVLNKSDAQKLTGQTPSATDKVSLPDYRYPGGKDPYHEPLQ